VVFEDIISFLELTSYYNLKLTEELKLDR